ncbi:MAG: ABC transporter ATP-binding protein [Phycisphaeraceae bacterium]
MSDTSAQTSEPVIQVRNLKKIYGGKTVLDSIDFDAHAGETLVIMGGSGCGKSTTLRCMIGSIRPDGGNVRIFGDDISVMPEAQLNEVRKKIGILFQSGALFNSMTLRQNVALPLEEHTQLDQQTIDIMVKIKLEMVGLREHADKYPGQLSGGMKKRAGLARALALDPRIIFYDEPSAGLDPVTSAQIDELIMDLSKNLGVTSVVVTHEMDSAFRIADRMVMLDKGRALMADRRQAFEALRDSKDTLDECGALIRQFLRGDAEGPITQRKQTTGYSEDLLGPIPRHIAPRPSVQATRRAAS